jgi:hypothetical protein
VQNWRKNPGYLGRYRILRGQRCSREPKYHRGRVGKTQLFKASRDKLQGPPNTQASAPHFAHGLHKPAKIRASGLKSPGIVGRDCVACSWEAGRKTKPPEVYHLMVRRGCGVQPRGEKVTKTGSVYATMARLKLGTFALCTRQELILD